MLRSRPLLLAAVALCLAAPSLPAQQITEGLAPADSRPSLVAPPSNSSPSDRQPGNIILENERYTPPAENYQPLDAYPRASQTSAVGSCECQPLSSPRYQPTQTLSPVTIPPAAYSSTYVPPPPSGPYSANRVVYQQPIVYRQTVASPVVYRQALPTVVSPAPVRYYLPPVIPVQNVPVGATIGRGVLGQPTVYVPGQPVRNFVRYLSP